MCVNSPLLYLDTPSRSHCDEAAAREFVGLLDASIRQHVGPTYDLWQPAVAGVVVAGQFPANAEK